ncbi:MAG: Stk1 family PASTA domain-containing Ser/Thr kinase [Eubacteriales bacterium]|jgi:serine/threonine protein kinase/beta-lactam-binding protein with PASTA domain|nr:Stk1 family PASTA domain-containing Ser/Thr kinase [Clostridiales bacterium]
MDSYERFIGKVLDGRYKIEKIIGVGGMAVVFRAYDPVMRRTVAIKRLKDDVAKDTAAVKRFINESKAVSMLSHPNIISIYDVSMSGESKYIVMEYVEGITLKNYMMKKGALPFPEIISFCEQILRALAHAHSKGIVHRDIKPQNIMLLKNGLIKVADFGIAKLPNAETVTMTDKAIGTVYYISPEQASGLPIDTRSDLYSTGVLMYEMATGQLPFSGETPVSVALMQVNATPTPPSKINLNIPLGLEQTILTAMEKSPDARFQKAEQILSRLEKLKKDPTVTFKPLPAPIVQGEGKDILNGESSLDENPPAAKPSKKRDFVGKSMFPIILAVASAFLIVCIVCGYYLLARVLFNKDLDKTFILTVDDFVGREYYDELDEELSELGYAVNVEYDYNDTAEAGIIIEQSPEPGEKRRVELGKHYCEITFVVSRGIETFIMPDFTMQDYRVVSDKLTKQYGVITKIEEKNNLAVPAGLVYGTSPQRGSTVTTGDTVILYVSLGPQTLVSSVPDFTGMTELKAKELLIKNNLSVGNVTYEYSDKPAGTIISQSRNASTTPVKAGTAIDFVVSLGPEPQTDENTNER